MSDSLTLTTSLAEFFKEKVKDSASKQNVNLSEEVEYYLVQLLTAFASPEKLFHINSSGKKELRPLALKLYDSIFDSEKKLQHLRSLGDSALYQAGVLYEGLMNKSVSVEYYISMGEQAYGSLANLTTSYDKNLSEIFYELSEKFSAHVEIVRLTFEGDSQDDDQDLMKWLQRYETTKSEKAKKKLLEKGICPDSLLGTKYSQ